MFQQLRMMASAGSEICTQVHESIWILNVEFCKNPWIWVIRTLMHRAETLVTVKEDKVLEI